MNIRPVLLALSTIIHPSAGLAQSCTGTPGPGSAKLSVEATDLRGAAGEVAFTVYADDPRKFLAPRGKLLRVRVPAETPVTRACFWLPAGRYALVQYHDENADHDFNRTLFMPKEGFGFSNDAPTAAGIPRLKDAIFSLPPEGATVRMRMRYRR